MQPRNLEGLLHVATTAQSHHIHNQRPWADHKTQPRQWLDRPCLGAVRGFHRSHTGCWNALHGPHNPRRVSRVETYCSSVRETGGALDDILTQQQQDLGPRLLAVDILRPPETGPNDIMDDVFYSTLCCAAAGGQLTFVGGQGQYPFAPPNGDHRPGLQSQAVQRFPPTHSWNTLVIQPSVAGHRPPQNVHRYGPPEFTRSGQKRSSTTRSTWTNADLDKWLGRVQPFQRTFHSIIDKAFSATTRNTLGHQS